MSGLTVARHMWKSPPSSPDGEPDAVSGGAAPRLNGRVRAIADLTWRERDQMYGLLDRYFAGASQRQFERDVAEKEWAILLTDAVTGKVQGFSTLMRLDMVVDGEPVVAFFSGDTIVHEHHWGDTVLPRLWAQHVFGLAAAVHGARPYWFLISSGYKTYRFLPVFFREFYPTYACPTPPHARRVLDALGRLKFPGEYDAARGVVRPASAMALRPGVADVTPERLQDPHVAYFVAANPGHAQGDELACIAELKVTNLTAAGRRMVRQK